MTHTIGTAIAAILATAAILMTLPWDVRGAFRGIRGWFAWAPGHIRRRMRHPYRRRLMGGAVMIIAGGVAAYFTWPGEIGALALLSLWPAVVLAEIALDRREFRDVVLADGTRVS